MNFLKKWYTYQKERFPLLAYGTYIFAIVFGIYCITTSHTTQFSFEWKYIIAMFCVALLQFLMVRIIDEFKDYEEDCKFRSYRPVPRGLITLKELKVLFIICALLQICITTFINIYGIIFLFIVWIFFFVMSKSFFIKKLLEKHILLEVALDELLMPILVLYLSVLRVGSFTSLLTLNNYYLFLGMTYVISWIVEIARKIRCKEAEEKGVKTYTAVFGIKDAIFILFVLQLLLFTLQTVILGKARIMITIVLFVIVSVINLLFVIKKNKAFSKLVELSANVYVFMAHISMILLVVGK